MKRSLFAALALASVSLSACADLPKVDVGAVVVSPQADAAAVKVETILATLITSFDLVVSDPAAQVDRIKLASQLASAGEILARARSAFDERGGGVSGVAGDAVGLIGQSVPDGTSMSARFAISIALASLQTYAASIDVTGAATPPSTDLIGARRRTDAALATLRAKLPPPGS